MQTILRRYSLNSIQVYDYDVLRSDFLDNDESRRDITVGAFAVGLWARWRRDCETESKTKDTEDFLRRCSFSSLA